MTDCNDDLLGLADWIRNPKLEDEAAVVRTLIGTFYHIIPHLNASGRLLLGNIPDSFNQHE
jgi:hypothetical protein